MKLIGCSKKLEEKTVVRPTNGAILGLNHYYSSFYRENNKLIGSVFTKRGSFSIYLFTDFEDYLPMPLDWIYPDWILMPATTQSCICIPHTRAVYKMYTWHMSHRIKCCHYSLVYKQINVGSFIAWQAVERRAVRCDTSIVRV